MWKRETGDGYREGEYVLLISNFLRLWGLGWCAFVKTVPVSEHQERSRNSSRESDPSDASTWISTKHYREMYQSITWKREREWGGKHLPTWESFGTEINAYDISLAIAYDPNPWLIARVSGTCPRVPPHEWCDSLKNRFITCCGGYKEPWRWIRFESRHTNGIHDSTMKWCRLNLPLLMMDPKIWIKNGRERERGRRVIHMGSPQMQEV